MISLELPAVFKTASELIGKALDFFGEDDKAKAEALLIDMKQQHDLAMGQIEINKNEALHRSLFVAGWRPAVGWICVIGLAFNYIISPYIFPFLYEYFPELRTLPTASQDLLGLVLGMLGLGGLRTFEKMKGLSK